MALKPDLQKLGQFVARRRENGWAVMYGRVNDARDVYLISFEAVQGRTPQEFTVKMHDPPLEDRDYFLQAANALITALRDFGARDRPYNVAAVPAPGDQFYVYLVPAQTEAGVYPLGGDARYLISPDGMAIREKRQLHKGILEVGDPKKADKAAFGTHSHVLSDVPEDTDVFHVLRKDPPIPEYVITRLFIYVIHRDGKIQYLGESEKLLKK
jgi:hypothetical protein